MPFPESLLESVKYCPKCRVELVRFSRMSRRCPNSHGYFFVRNIQGEEIIVFASRKR